MSHLKGLLKKDLYLFSYSWKRILCLFILPIAFPIFMNYKLPPDEITGRYSRDSFHYGYLAGGLADLDGNRYKYYECKEHNYAGTNKKIIGLIVEGADWNDVKDRIEKIINRNTTKEHLAIFMQFYTEEELIAYAARRNTDPNYPGEYLYLCKGIKFVKEGNNYSYTIYTNQDHLRRRGLHEEIYNELAL